MARLPGARRLEILLMTCQRCHGLSVKDPLDKCGHWWWRCYNCGDRVDRSILLNRAEQEAFECDRAAALERDLKEWADWMAKIPAAATV